MFTIRAVVLDYYLCKPIEEYNTKIQSLFEAEPVLRIFGSTADGVKSCVHIHGVYPYIYVPYIGGENPDRDALLLGVALDEALKANTKKQNYKFVYNVSLVSGIPLYGYHSKHRQFFKVFFYNPYYIKQASELLLSGAIFGQKLQPHEAHIPFVLQFMMDYNIYGMSFVTFSKIKYRRNLENPDFLKGVNEADIFSNKIQKITCSNLEVDALASDIVNKINSKVLDVNPGLRAIWEEEKNRVRKLSRQFPTDFEESPPRMIGNAESAVESIYKELLRKKLEKIRNEEESILSDETKHSYPAEVPEGGSFIAASEAGNPEESLIEGDVPDIRNLINEHILTEIYAGKTEVIDSESEEERMEVDSVLGRNRGVEEEEELEDEAAEDLTQPLDADENFLLRLDANRDEPGTSCSDSEKQFWKVMAEKIFQFDGAQDSSSESDRDSSREKAFYLNNLDKEEPKSRIAVGAAPSRSSSAETLDPEANWSSNIMSILNEDTICPTPTGICQTPQSFWSSYSPKIDPWLSQNHDSWIFNKSEASLVDCFSSESQTNNSSNFSAAPPHDSSYNANGNGMCLNFSFSNGEVNPEKNSGSVVTKNSFTDGGAICSDTSTGEAPRQISFAVDEFSDDTPNIFSCFELEKPSSFSSRDDRNNTNIVSSPRHHRVHKTLENDKDKVTNIFKRFATSSKKSVPSSNEEKVISLTLKQYIKDCSEIVNVDFKNLCNRDMVVIEYKTVQGKSGQSKFLIKPLDKFLERWDSAEKKINSKLSKNFEKNLEKFNKTIASKEDEAVNSNGNLFEHKCTDDWLESAELTSVRNKFLVKSVEMVADGGDVLNVHDAKSYKINENVISRGKIKMKIIKSQQENLEKDAFKCVKKKKIMIAKSQNYSKKKTTDFVKKREEEKKGFPTMLDVESERSSLKPARSGKRKKLNFREDFAKDWEKRKENKNMSAFEAKLINQINSSFEEYFKNIVKLNRCRGRSENSVGVSKDKEEKKRRMEFSSGRPSGKASRAAGGRRKAAEGSRSSWSSVDPVEVVTRFLSTYSRMSRPSETPPLSITISLGGGNGAAPAPIQLNFQPVVAAPRKEGKRCERKNKGKLKIENVDGAADGSSEDSANGDSRARAFVGQKRMKRDGFYKPLNVVVRSGTSRRKKMKASADGDREVVQNSIKEDFFCASRVMPESLPGPSRKIKIENVDFTDPSSSGKQDKSLTKGCEGEARQNTESESDFIYDSDEKSNADLSTSKNKTKFRRKILRKKKRSLVDSASHSVIKAPVNLPGSKSVNAIERSDEVNADEKNSNSEVFRFYGEKCTAELKKSKVLADGKTKDVDKIWEDCDKNFQPPFGTQEEFASNLEKLSSEDHDLYLSQISFANDFLSLPQAKRFLSLPPSLLPSIEGASEAKSEPATDSRLTNDVPIAAESLQISATNSVSLESQSSSHNFRYNTTNEDAFLLPFASGGNINSFESHALEPFNKKINSSKNQRLSAELSKSSLIGSEVVHKSNRVIGAESVCNSRTIYPRLKPPSKNRVDEFLRKKEIITTTATTPFYGDFRDLTKAMETGPRILKISTHSIAGLKSHETAAEISGIEERRGHLLQWDNACCLFPCGKTSTVTPLSKPPSWINATEWLKSKGRPKVKPKDRIKLVRPLSLGRESDSDAESEQSMSMIFLEEEVGGSSTEATSSENASSNYSKAQASVVWKKTFSGKPLTKNPSSKGKGIGELNRLEAVEENKEMAPERSSSAGNDNGSALKEVWRRSLDNSFQIRGVTCDDTLGFQESVENFNFKHTYQHVSLMEMELHIQTRKDLRPDPRYDPIRALFYVIKFDRPDQKQETGMVVVGDGLLSGTGISNDGVRYVATEVALFEKTVELLKTWDPDILAGYEIEMLSWGYFIQRGFVLEMNLFDLLGRIRNGSFGCRNPSDFVGNCVPEEDDFDDVPKSVKHMRISGRIVLDIWRVLRHEVVLTSYTFESVMYHLCHERHPLLSHEKLSFYWEHSSHRYRHIVVTHYLTRVVGVIRLLDQLDFINRTSELSRLFGIQFYEVLSRGSQYRVESMMLRLAKPLNYIPASPSVAQRAAMRAPASLPLVMEPESVFYTEPVIVLDFQSLYPSMIIAYNYCFSTCIGRVENLGGYEPFEFGCSQLQISPEELKKLENNINISPAGVAFVKPTVRKGILPTMLEAILDTRLMVKKSMKENKDNKTLQKLLFARQLGLKLIANVTYGYTAANFSGRMPCVEVGDSVVSKGRETLERAIKLIKNTPEWKAKVVYGDTDSIFVLTPGRTMQESFKVGAQIAEAVTQSNPKPVKLKLEKVYQPCILQTKKRYVGYMYESPDQKEPVFEAKGIETVRRDGCPAAGKILRKSLHILFDTKDVSLVKKYAVRQFTKIFQGKVNIQDLIFAKEYRGRKGYRPGACVPALELAKQWTVRDRRAEPRVRERVPYVIANGPPGVPLIRLVRSPKDFLADPSLRPNAAYYITKAVIPPLQRCLSLLGADVVSWYSEMPRKFHKTFKSESVELQRRKTISQYFPTVDCIVCSKTTNNFLCSECQTAPQKVAVHLGEKIRRLERCYAGILKICQSCCGRTSELECLCLDCPVLFRRSQATRELDQATALREIIQRHI